MILLISLEFRLTIQTQTEKQTIGALKISAVNASVSIILFYSSYIIKHGLAHHQYTTQEVDHQGIQYLYECIHRPLKPSNDSWWF